MGASELGAGSSSRSAEHLVHAFSLLSRKPVWNWRVTPSAIHVEQAS